MDKKNLNAARIKNCDNVKLKSIPVIGYDEFTGLNSSLVSDGTRHCSLLFAVPSGKKTTLFSIISDDIEGDIICSGTVITPGKAIPSITALHGSFHPFERDMHESCGIEYTDHPWLKPLRFPAKGATKKIIEEYPFLYYDSEDLHEVGVGPIHAGVIEPGHFRFICNGEKVLHLEIQLGYQHRGIEELFLKKKNLLERVILSESIAGDTIIGHSTAFALVYESLCSFEAAEHLSFTRTLALELERMAVHTGDMAALSGDIAYQLGNAVFGRLRTPLINYTQSWGGNRLGRGLIRPGRTNFPYNQQLADSLASILDSYEKDYTEMSDALFALPGAQARFEKTGKVSKEDAVSMGAVGMAARTCGLRRDIRSTHPHSFYNMLKYDTAVLESGDVYARAAIRDREIRKSIELIRKMLNSIPAQSKNVDLSGKKLPQDSLCVALTEGWRGEICHAAITGGQGEIISYKIKDPSVHNWFALAMAVRNQEISDFPLCNKSFNLSYCGHDL